MITVVLCPNESKKHLGMVACNSSRSGHLTRGPKQISMTVSHVNKIQETIDDEIFKLYARSR
jgi:hypothetical protein